MLASFIKHHHLPDVFEQTANNYYLPIAEQITHKAKTSSVPLFVGINGCQGSGKSTLASFLAAYISEKHQLNVLVMSLDDFYLSQAKRQVLAQTVHPLLATRGVPGTHDTKLMAEVFKKLSLNQSDFVIPRFNKAADEPCDKSQWQHVDSTVDIVLFEGWCWGINAQSLPELESPVNALEQRYDAEGIWRQYVNAQLINQYQPLYRYFDFWVVLQAPSFDCVYRWRLEQEEKLAKHLQENASTSKVMTAQQVNDFIQFFQRLTEHGLATLGQSADILLTLDSQRQIMHSSYGETS
ncbi:kinase [Thalassotalea piscium]